MYEYVTSALGFNPDRHAGKIVGLAAYGDPKILGDVLHSMFVWDGPVFRIRRSSDVYLARYLSTIFPKIDLAARLSDRVGRSGHKVSGVLRQADGH